MRRYNGFSDPFQVQVAIHEELKRMNEKQDEIIKQQRQLVKLLQPQEEAKPKRGGKRETDRSDGGNHGKAAK